MCSALCFWLLELAPVTDLITLSASPRTQTAPAPVKLAGRGQPRGTESELPRAPLKLVSPPPVTRRAKRGEEIFGIAGPESTRLPVN